MGTITLIRHGETEWSASGRHTGVTDLPLTAAGERQAGAIGAALHGAQFSLVLSSPRSRALRTAELAGLTGVVVDDDLAEWDYGGYEGLTTEQITADQITGELGRPWRLFTDGVVPGITKGETIEQVATRAAAVLDRVRDALAEGDVALVGHGHQLRVLATVWLHCPAVEAAKLRLGTGTISRLGWEHGLPAIDWWNLAPQTLAGRQATT